MKKLLAVLLSLMLAMSMVACGGEEAAEEVEEVVEEVEVEEEAVEEEVVEEEPVEEEVVEEAAEEFTGGLFDLPALEAPELAGTTWSIAGAMFDGVELEEDELENEVLTLYGGQLDFTFDAEGGAQMVQGNGALDGSYQYSSEGTGVMLGFDYNGEELRYACVFTDIEGTLVTIAMPDMTGVNGLYFVQN